MYIQKVGEIVPPPRHNSARVCHQITFLVLSYCSSMLVPLLKVINAPIQVPDLVDLTVSMLPDNSRNILIYILISSNKLQQYAGIYLLQNYSTCFGCPSHPSSGVHKTVTAASGTGHITYLSNDLPPAWPNKATSEESCCSDTMTCTRGCSYSFMYS